MRPYICKGCDAQLAAENKLYLYYAMILVCKVLLYYTICANQGHLLGLGVIT